MPGYDLKINGEYARIESLQCSSCELILKDAIQNEDGQRFCKSCWEEAISSSSKAQKLGINPKEEIHPDIAVRREIDRLPVLCENYENGCDWTGKLKDHEHDHKAICEYKTMRCPLGCGKRIPLGKLRKHEKEECPFRQVRCQYCRSELLAGDYDDHLLNCPNAPYTCGHCHTEMPRSEMVSHMLLNCREQLSCSGCQQQIHKSLSKHPNPISHLENDQVFMHLQMLGLAMKRLETHFNVALKDIKKELTEIDESNSKFKDKMINESSSLTKQVKQLEERLKGEPSNRIIIELQGEVTKLAERVSKVESGASYRPLNQGYDDMSTSDSKMGGSIEHKLAEQERTSGMLKVHLSELELQLQASLASTYNGSFLWRIPDVKRRKRDAIEGKITSIYSPPFYTGRNGYKMCIRAYLNGDGIGYNTHLSIFFVLMKGEYDPLLKWPFDFKVSLIMVDQDHKRHIVQTFKPSPSSSSFQRPKSDMNIASGCPKFAELKILDNESYVKEDVMYVKAIVDTTRIFHP
ncbi:PREDICTED: TNF receptor-associated factor 2-like isoform X2 [Amphimedon queenslandica]|uniref:TNF receptor-associated factor n=1 Tax=Amphimedon queenslandica TaxID=400682 RepID=A0A1X7TNS4_AMPQE|nr:PREDICTED: TNF receptor-associated factor 2-like isoform X2 [Amphimedon queenslandica]|eukprot:XP_019858615.1 PREDICTED: TNF receptor-associated factor 2-like isoform X2 [Amphimedon queenslandica]